MFSRYFCFLFVVLEALFCGFAWAESGKTAGDASERRIFTVPMTVEGKSVDSNVYLSLPFSEINKKYSSIKQAELSGLSNPERLLIRLIEVVESKDSSKLAALVDPEDQILSKLGEDAYTDRFHASLGAFSPDKMVVEGVIHRKWGERVVVSSEQSNGDRRQYRIFSFKRVGSDYLYTDSVAESFDPLINHVFKTYPVKIQRMLKGNYMWYPEGYVAGQTDKDAGEDAAFLVFNGEYLSKKVLGKKKGKEDSIEKLLADAKRYLQKKDLNGYARLFYDQSRKRVLEAIEKAGLENVKSIPLLDESALPFFKLNVNKTLSILFLKKDVVGDNYFYALEKGKKAFFTNYGLFSSVDSLLRSQSFLQFITDKQ